MNLDLACRSSKILLLLLACDIWSGCSALFPLQEHRIGEIGRFEFREADIGSKGVVIAVPRSGTEPAAVEYAHSMRDGLGAALILAYDFARKQIPVSEPLVQNSLVSWQETDSIRPGNVYPVFKKLLQSAALGPVKFYVGVRFTESTTPVQRVEVATNGFSFAQLIALKQVYVELRDRRLKNLATAAKIDIAINPLDDLSSNSYGERNHGVLMLAEKGLIFRLPKILADNTLKAAYREILTEWVKAVIRNLDKASQVHAVRFERLTYGRIDTISPPNVSTGVVIAAPHGSFDWYTAELVEEISYRTALPAVITRGFTPTECGGWRINVNRPTERRYPTDTIERKTKRAGEVYERFRDTVFQAAGGRLNTYIEMHQNGTEADIDVATVGISRDEAIAIKKDYREIRDRILQGIPDLVRVDLVIEPVDQVAIGAWAAKDDGMLRVSQASLHFELPAERVFFRQRARRAYTRILSELIDRLVKSRYGSSEAKLISSPLHFTAD